MQGEAELEAHIKQRWSQYFPKYRLIQFQMPVLGCITGDKIGYVDFAFKTKTSKFLVEIKNTDLGTVDFWAALKVVGYAKSMNLTFFKNSKNDHDHYRPVIMIKKEILTYDLLPILYQLRCGYIAFEIKENFVDMDIHLNHLSASFI